jgi:hypothetical protein
MPSDRREEVVAGAAGLAVASWLGRLQDASFSRAGRALRTAYPPQRMMTGPQLARVPGAPDLRARVDHPARRPCTCRADTFLPIRGGVLAAHARRRGPARQRPGPSVARAVHPRGRARHPCRGAHRGPGRGDGDRSRRSLQQHRVRNRGASLDWATDWLEMTPQRLYSFAETAWEGVADSLLSSGMPPVPRDTPAHHPE